MTKDQLTFSIMNVIRGQAPTQDSGKLVHPQDIELEIEKAYETIVYNFLSNPEVKANIQMEYFSKSYDLAVKEDDKGLFVDLPVTPMPLPGGGGFQLVTPKGSQTYFNVIGREEFLSFMHLEAFCCSPIPYAYPEISEKKLYLQGNRPEYSLVDEITVELVIRFSDYAGSDTINTPGGNYPITGMILQQMGYRATDNTNDDVR